MAIQDIAAAMNGQPAAPTPFTWGSNGAQLTPQQAAARQQVAMAMMAQAPAPRSLGEGLSAIGRALVAKDMMDQGVTAQTAGLQQAGTDFPNVQSGKMSPAAFIANDPYATDGQKAVASAMMAQAFQQSSPDAISARALQAAETGKDVAEAGMFANGGAVVGTPFQTEDGHWHAATQYGAVRDLGTLSGSAPGGPSTPPGSVSSADLPSLQAPGGAGDYVTPPTSDGSPVPLAPAAAPTASVVSPASNAPPALTAAPSPFVSAQQKGAEATADALGKAAGDLPVQINDALSNSRSVNPLYFGAINNINRALNSIDADKGVLNFSTGLGGVVGAKIPGTPGYDLAQALGSLAGLSALTTMSSERGPDGNSSPIQIRNQREFNAVASAAGSVDQFQSKAQLTSNLKSLKQMLAAGMNNRAQDISDLRQMGKLSGGLPASSDTDPFIGPGGFGAVKVAPDGMPTVTSPQEALSLPPGTKFYLPDGRVGTVPAPAPGAQ